MMLVKQETNPSGIVPFEYKAVVYVKDDNKNEHGEHVTGGGIIIAKSTTEREEMAKIEAILIDVGGNCFEDWKGATPQIGDTVVIAKYAGSFIEGEDGKEYRMINDKDIGAKRVKL